MALSKSDTPRRRLIDKPMLRYGQWLLVGGVCVVTFIATELLHARNYDEAKSIVSSFAGALSAVLLLGGGAIGVVFKNQQQVAASRAELLEVNEKQLKILQDQINENASKIMELGEKNTHDLAVAKAEKDRDIAQLQSDHAADMQQMADKHEAEIATLRRQIETLSNEKDERTRWNERLQRDNDELIRINANCEAERKATELRLSELEQQNADLADELMKERAMREELEVEVARLKKEIEYMIGHTGDLAT